MSDDKRRYYHYSDADIVIQFLFQILTGYDIDYACKKLKSDAYFPKLLETGQVASQPTLSRFLSRSTEATVGSLRRLNFELVQLFLQMQSQPSLIVDVDSTHFTTYGHQEGADYNAHYQVTAYHPLYAFESQTGYCLNAQLRSGNRYCSEGADALIHPILEQFDHLIFRMDSGFVSPKLYDLLEDRGHAYLTKLKRNAVLSRLGDLTLPCSEDLSILPHSSYSESLYKADSWRQPRRVCQFSQRQEGGLFYDVVSLVTNLSSVDSEELFQFYRERGNAENFIKERKAGFFGDKTDSSTMVKNEVRMMMGYLAYNLYLFLKQLAGDEVKALTIKRFRPLFLHIAENMSLLLDDIFSNSQVYTPIQNSFKPYLIQSAR